LFVAASELIGCPFVSLSFAMAQPLRVVHLGKYYPPAPGGIESLVRDMAVAQVQAGLHVSAHVFQHQHHLTTEVENAQGVHLVRHQRRASFAKLDISPDLIDYIRQIRADVIHLHVPNPSMILGLLANRRLIDQIPVVVGYHADVVRQKLRSMIFRPLERRFYRHVAAITTPSPMYATGSHFLRAYADRLRTVPLALELQSYLNPSEDDQQTAQTLRKQARGPIWLACGRLVYYKGFFTAIDALSKTKTGGELWIIGTGPEKERLQAHARQMGMADRVRFLGHVARTVPYYHAADAFWFPSNARSESFGLAQVEAMASGCPVINTNIANSGVPWVSIDQISGVTVPVGDANALAHAADMIASNSRLRQQFAEGARLRAAQEFDIRVMVDRLSRLYGDVLGKSVKPCSNTKLNNLAEGPLVPLTASASPA